MSDYKLNLIIITVISIVDHGIPFDKIHFRAWFLNKASEISLARSSEGSMFQIRTAWVLNPAAVRSSRLFSGRSLD